MSKQYAAIAKGKRHGHTQMMFNSEGGQAPLSEPVSMPQSGSGKIAGKCLILSCS